jgi:hypothetical protein
MAAEPATKHDFRKVALDTVWTADREADRKHGPLKGGMDRWAHHLREECDEAVAEMWALKHNRQDSNAKTRLIVELAQVAQLAIRMIEMVYQNREWEEADTWEPKPILEPKMPGSE